MGNKGAFIRFEADNVPKFTQYEAVPHPNVPAMRYAGNIFGL
jgi:serine/threonine-protein phosphatase 5